MAKALYPKSRTSKGVSSSPQKAGKDSPAHSHIPAHTPTHFKKFSLKGVKGS